VTYTQVYTVTYDFQLSTSLISWYTVTALIHKWSMNAVAPACN